MAKSPALPDGAGVPQAVTSEERAALALFLNWVAELVDHDKGATDQADLARREACPT